jgi:tRNA (cytidine/uridine-2'-O-)-methyltransferase
MRLALYQPDIAQNTGTILRMCACLGIPADIIEPCGFPINSPKFKRAGMDYLHHVQLERHNSWEDFYAQKIGRLVLLTPHTDNSYYDFKFEPSDILILGQETCGVPESVMNQADALIKIPMSQGMRSLNVAIAGAMVLSEALRQITKG